MNIFNKVFCRHKNIKFVRWHYCHIPDYEPAGIEVELFCPNCNKYIYKYFPAGKWRDSKEKYFKMLGYEEYKVYYDTKTSRHFGNA